MSAGVSGNHPAIASTGLPIGKKTALATRDGRKPKNAKLSKPVSLPPSQKPPPTGPCNRKRRRF